MNAGLPCRPSDRQHGVVMLVCLVLLIALCFGCMVALSGTTSGQAIASNARKQALAKEAAEAALSYCENAAAAYALDPTQGIAPLPAPSSETAYVWRDMSRWDAGSAAPTVVAFADSAAASAGRYVHRPPECISQFQIGDPSRFVVVTARGFGPEVPLGTGKPDGTEVWLQSEITLPAAVPPASSSP